MKMVLKWSYRSKQAEPGTPRPKEEVSSAPKSDPQADPKIEDYRNSIKKVLEAEVAAIITEEVKNGSKEIIEEYRRGIREIVEEHKRILAEELEQHKMTARAGKEELRHMITRLNLT
jgi:hypothetical protein